MFCIHCGKSNPENARFCAHCGKTLYQTNEPEIENEIEWEYTFFHQVWKLGDGGRYPLTNGKTEYSVRLDNWGRDENSIMPELQDYLDKGWQYVTSPGPNSYKFVYDSESSGGTKFTVLLVGSFVVDFRRPARPLTEKEKLLVGIWQETRDPNKGFWNTVGNMTFSQKITVDKHKYEFFKDHRFKHTNRDGLELDGGIFYEKEQGKLKLYFKYLPDWNIVVDVTNGKLIFKYNNPKEYERIV